MHKTRRPRCPDFPPGRPSCEGWPSDHPACPPCKVYHLEAIACSADGTEKYINADARGSAEIILRVRDSTQWRLILLGDLKRQETGAVNMAILHGGAVTS